MDGITHISYSLPIQVKYLAYCRRWTGFVIHHLVSRRGSLLSLEKIKTTYYINNITYFICLCTYPHTLLILYVHFKESCCWWASQKWPFLLPQSILANIAMRHLAGSHSRWCVSLKREIYGQIVIINMMCTDCRTLKNRLGMNEIVHGIFLTIS